MPRKAPKSVSLHSIEFWLQVTTLWSAITLDFPAWWACWFCCRGCSLSTPHAYLLTSPSSPRETVAGW
jgi:hypothetical protein